MRKRLDEVESTLCQTLGQFIPTDVSILQSRMGIDLLVLREVGPSCLEAVSFLLGVGDWWLPIFLERKESPSAPICITTLEP